ncbi:MAG TPA: DUF1801 domain-containing protein, partial [Candidatus Sulfopaludibacter sp.]|jgi:hypothetical protein|nr:DUF1801 domain-containing protein [Candidatus Sulfopaludibacter sp.]
MAVPPASADHLRFLSAYGPNITALALSVRQMVMEEAAGSSELIYDAYNAVASGYSFTGRPSDACIHIAVYAKWVNLGFNRGADLPDPKALLQGAGRQIRHIRIASDADLQRPFVRRFVKAAVARAARPKQAMAAVTQVRGNYPQKRRPL